MNDDIIVRELVPFEVSKRCNVCYTGELIVDYNSPVLTTYPPKYTLKCEKCGNVITSSTKYPYIEYRYKHDEGTPSVLER